METMQQEITEPCELLDGDGHITREGWARQPYWRYDRRKIKAGWHRIKEWDYYAILSQEGGFGVTLTMSDLGYAGLFALCWLDFESGRFHQVDTLKPFTRGRVGFPATSDEGRISFADKKLDLDFRYEAGRRHLSFAAPGIEGPDGARGIEGSVTLEQPGDLESMNIAASWSENRRAFYYNRKVNCMPASGELTLGTETYRFDPEQDLGVLDWGRGRWTYHNRWFWGSASGVVDGHHLGWNIGYGFSDRTPASENVLFYDGRAHKLSEVEFHFDPSDYMRPWRFTSDDGRLELDFEPAIDRNSKFNVLLISSVQHQVFGYFTGQVVLDDGLTIEVERLLGFAEDVLNRW